MLKSHIADTVNTEECAEVYEMMSTTSSQDIMMKYSGVTEDIYESMLGINPECAEDLCKFKIILFCLILENKSYKTIPACLIQNDNFMLASGGCFCQMK